MFQFLLVGALILVSQSTLNGKYPDAIHCGGENTRFSGAIYFIHTTKQDDKLIYYCQVIGNENRWVSFKIDDGNYNDGVGSYESRKGCQNKSLPTLDSEGRTIYYALDPSKGKSQKKLDEENAILNRIAKLEEREMIKDKQAAKMEEEFTAMKSKMAKMEEENTAIKNKMAKMAKAEDEEIMKDKKIEKLQNKISELKKKLLSFSANFWDYEQIKQKWVKDFKKEMLAEIKKRGLQIGSRWKLQQEGAAFVIRDLEGSNVKDSRISFAQDTFSNPK